jgi:hypothetical protein
MAHISTARPHPDEHLDAAARWQAHVTAGRLGRRLPVDPAVAAIRDANEAIFLRRAGAAR